MHIAPAPTFCPVCLNPKISTSQVTGRAAHLIVCDACGTYLLAPPVEFTLSTFTPQQRGALGAYIRSHQKGPRVVLDVRNVLQFVNEGSSTPPLTP